MAQRSPVEFLEEVVQPALFDRLDAAFPGFGWKRTSRGWTATNREFTKALPSGPRPDRVVCNHPHGFLVHGSGPTSWTAYVSGGAPPHGADFVAAVRTLAELAGVDASALDRPLTPEEAERHERHERRQALLESFVAGAQVDLRGESREAAQARDHLAGRGFPVDELDTLPFGLFTTRANVQAQLVARGFTPDEVKDAGLLADGRWAGRLVLPWRDHRGRIATVAARDVAGEADAGAKYLYLKGHAKPPAFGLDVALRRDAGGRDHLVLVEGLLDVVALQARGFGNVAALGGDGKLLDKERWEDLAGLGVRSATLCLDNDAAGRDGTRAALDALQRAKVDLAVYAVDPAELGESKDPDELLRRHGLPALEEVLDRRLPGPLYRGLVLLQDVTPESPDHARREAAERVLSYVDRLRGPRAALDVEDLLHVTAERTGYTVEGLADVAQLHAERRRRDEAERTVRVQLRQAEDELAAGGDPAAVAAVLRDALAEVQVQAQELPPSFDVDRLVAETAHLPQGRSSGWANLDAAEVSFHPGELALLAARTSHGKTATMSGLLHNWLWAGESSGSDELLLFYSLEEPELRIFHRLLSLLTVVEQCDRPSSWWTANEVRACLGGRPAPSPDGSWPGSDVTAAKGRLRSWQDRLQVVYRPGWTVDDLAAHAATVAQARPVGAVLVDYLQRLPPPAGRYDRRDIEVSLIGRRLKALAVDLSVPVVAGAQLNRQTVTDGKSVIPPGAYEDEKVQKAIRSRRPQLHHLREGGSEQEADLVLGLLNYRADYVEDDTGERREGAGSVPDVTRLEVGVLKNRYGPVGRWVPLAFAARYGYLRDPESAEEV